MVMETLYSLRKIEDLMKYLRIFILYSIMSFLIFTMLNISGVRLFNSLNLTMSLSSGGGFLPSDRLNNIISTNFQKIVLTLSLIFSMINFYFLFNIFNKKLIIKEHKEDFYLIGLAFIFTLLIYFNNFSGLDTIISVLSSLSNSGISLIKTDNNLSLFFNPYDDGEMGMLIMITVLFISFASQVGDLTISFFKRKSKIKNTGKIIPGHGGFLDRCDSLLLSTIFIFIPFYFNFI